MAKNSDDKDVVQQLGDMWDAAKADLDRLRNLAENAAALGKVQASISAAKSEREIALMNLGEAFYKLVESGQLTAPLELKRAIGEVKAKDVAFLRQQADIAAILKEADSLVEANKGTNKPDNKADKMSPKKKI